MTAIFPGSFDPVTLGHIDLIKRGIHLFDRVIVAVLHNAVKSPMFTAEERVDLLREATAEFPGVDIVAYSGLLANLAGDISVKFILRGVRSEADCAYELPMAQANRRIGHDLETVMLTADPAHSYVSSGMIREIATAGYGNPLFDDKVLDQWVPPAVKNALRSKLTEIS